MPVRIRRFRFYQKAEGLLYTHCILQEKAPDDYFVGDVFIYDEDGHAVASAEGLKCQNLQRVEGEIPEKLDGWLHEYRWQEASLTRTSSPEEPQEIAQRTIPTWLVLADGQGVGRRVAELLGRQGYRVAILQAGENYRELDRWIYEFDPTNPDHVKRAINELGDDSRLVGAVHLSSLDAPSGEQLAIGGLRDSYRLGYGSALHMIQALLEQKTSSPRVWLVTNGAFDVVEDDAELHPTQAPLWGLGRVTGNEHPELRPSLVDLSPRMAPSEVDALADELLAQTAEDEIALRGTRRYVHRFQTIDKAEMPSEVDSDEPSFYALHYSRRRGLDALYWQEQAPHELGPGEVEIHSYAVGLNFKDVMKATGLLPQSVMEKNFWQRALGMECAGVITRVGREVAELAPGDEVVGFAHHAFSSHVVTDERLVARKPNHLSFAEAATIPLAFVTAYYALHDQGRLEAGEKVLIHAASGGVGQAAMMLARRAGATIFATAGADEKRRFVREAGASLVLDSRSLEFAQQIRRATRGTGVDLIVNSLTGEAIDRNLDILSDYGRFLELGKIDIDSNQRVGMRVLDKNASLHGIDLDRLLAQKPDVAGRLLQEVMTLFEKEELRPLPLQTFSTTAASEAFQHMASAKHIGKVVLTFDEKPKTIQKAGKVRLSAQGSYLITGGFGGFGLELIDWLVQHGARHLIIVSRSGARSPDAKQMLVDMQQQGIRIDDERFDIADETQVQQFFAQVSETSSPIKGIFHAAAILDDDLLKNQSLDKYRTVAASKLEGAWILHKWTKHLPLDHFVMFSSVTSVLGNQGSANYVAANCFVDALAHHRRNLGLPALTVNWGLIANVGMAQQDPEIRRHLEEGGLVALHTRHGLKLLGRELEQRTTQVTIAPVNWPRWLKFHHKDESPRFSRIAQSDESVQKESISKLDRNFDQKMLEANPQDRQGLAREAVRKRVGQVFGTAAEKVDVYREFTALGLDSLMALELRSRLEELGLALSVSSLLEGSTVDSLAERLANAYQKATSEEPAEAPKGTSDAPEGGTWIVTPEPNPGARVKLFCFPYAGGAPTAFHDWGQEFPGDFEVSAINLPGRGRRIGDPAHGNISDMADEIVLEMLPHLDRSFAFFGHCMGSIIMYEVAERLRSQHGLLPVRLFAGGSMAPHLYQSSLVYEQPDPKFMDVLALLDFTKTRVMLEDDEMRNLLMPTLRADFEAVVNYSRDFQKREPLDCPITGFAAKRDLFAAPSSMLSWDEYTSGSMKLWMLDVHHYFVETHRTFLIRQIAADLAVDLDRDDTLSLVRAAEEMHSMAEAVDFTRDSLWKTEEAPHLHASEWIERHQPKFSSRMRLYCFPSALGRQPGARLLGTELAEQCEICLITPPPWTGRAPSIKAQAQALAKALASDAEGPFAFFGHCSGAILMYEVARCLRDTGGPLPEHLFGSSAAAPHLYVMPNAHLLGDEKLVDVLDVIGHPLTEHLRSDSKLRKNLIPRIRAEFEMMATYWHEPASPLDCPITVLRARNDLWTFFYGTEAWDQHTTAHFRLITDEDGDHFHIEKDPQLTIQTICETMGIGWGSGVHAVSEHESDSATESASDHQRSVS